MAIPPFGSLYVFSTMTVGSSFSRAAFILLELVSWSWFSAASTMMCCFASSFSLEPRLLAEVSVGICSLGESVRMSISLFVVTLSITFESCFVVQMTQE